MFYLRPTNYNVVISSSIETQSLAHPKDERSLFYYPKNNNLKKSYHEIHSQERIW